MSLIRPRRILIIKEYLITALITKDDNPIAKIVIGFIICEILRMLKYILNPCAFIFIVKPNTAYSGYHIDSKDYHYSLCVPHALSCAFCVQSCELAFACDITKIPSKTFPHSKIQGCI